MIGSLARHKALPLAFATSVVVGVGHLHCSIHRLRARIHEKNMIQSIRGELCHASSQFKTQRLTELERRHVGGLLQLGINSLGDFGARVTGSTTKQTGRPI